MKNDMEKIAAAIGSVKRLKIIAMLDKEELTVSQITNDLGLSQSLTSQNLAKLREANIVEFTKEGHTAIYRLVDSPLVDLITQLANEMVPQ